MAGRHDKGSGGEPARAGEPDVGPYDAENPPNDNFQRLDLGSLLLPTLPDLEVQMQAMENGQIAAVVVASADSALQLGVYAAPRSEGIWGDVRTEIAESVTADGGKTEEVEGEYGVELLAHVTTPEGQAQLRFIGVDGPRWFLRGLFQGQAAVDAAAAEPFMELLHKIVVFRDKDARPVREPLPLRLPKEFAAEAARQQAEQSGEQSGEQVEQAPPVQDSDSPDGKPRRRTSPRPRDQ
ncbi:MAG: DUF3710 domain-containing protein [Longispora sp.]|nr:DUF3710 domain-containing protein [Longispora sp. (in: high G+C Gram-positive bacteria)]